MQKKMKVIMVDQDGVISDKNYQTTKDISQFVDSLRTQGIIIVPNSDTPIDRLQRNNKFLLGFHADTIIGEKGAVVSLNGQCKFPKEIQGIDEYRLSLEKLFLKCGVSVYVGDSATWIRENKTFIPNSQLLIIDALRQQSIGLYLKCSNDKGLTYTDLDWCEKGLKIISTISLPIGLEPLNFNPNYGIAIANATGVKKSDGYRIIKEFFGQTRYYMIGDQMDDFIDDSNVVQCAVGNAEKKYKDVSSFVASKRITEGLEECLQWIVIQ